MNMACVLENSLESALLALIFSLNLVGCTQIQSSCDARLNLMCARLMYFTGFYFRCNFK